MARINDLYPDHPGQPDPRPMCPRHNRAVLWTSRYGFMPYCFACQAEFTRIFRTDQRVAR